MREILFRGKRVDNNEMIYGYLYRISEKLNPFIMLINSGGESHEVFPETVGQYTGLTDKNGVKIFEGDIVRYSGEKHIVVFETRGETGYFGIKIDHIETWEFCLSVPAKLMEVIGNIHDNPELAEGAVMTEELKPCPFCGGKATIVYCDDEGNLHGDDYEDDPWSGLGYRIRHSHEENEDCPIARYAEDGATMGDVYIYDTREEAIEAWNRRTNDAEIH